LIFKVKGKVKEIFHCNVGQPPEKPVAAPQNIWGKLEQIIGTVKKSFPDVGKHPSLTYVIVTLSPLT
jgi:hypothetical protein